MRRPPSRRSTRSHRRTPHKPTTKQVSHEYELEVLAGLEAIATEELEALSGSRDIRGLRFWYSGDLTRVHRLRTPVAAYRVKSWNIPRPKGFLGHQVLGELVAFLQGVIEIGGHTSFRISAAGKESSVMERLSNELAAALGMPEHSEGELLIRFRPAEEGWEVLARTTSRPLSARAWRTCNMSGGLNATIAYAMHRAVGIRPEDRMFNPMCGSGTLLIERVLAAPIEAMVGVDHNEAAVSCAMQNILACGKPIEVAQRDALHTELPDRCFDLIVADLPWGDAINSHVDNAVLYPAFLKEMHRLLTLRGRLCVLTHEIKLFENLLRDHPLWRSRELFQVYSGGHHPKAYVLYKK